MHNQCPLCSTVVFREEELTFQICDKCADELEFGYPSFPAYSLEG